MRPLTDDTPKPLLEVRGQPLIAWHLRALARAGITDVVVNVAHLGEQIEQALGCGKDYGLEITVSREPEGLETAGGIVNALPYLGDTPFIVVNADVWTEYDFSQLMGKALDGSLAHLVMVPTPPFKESDDFYLRDDGQLAVNPPGQAMTFAGVSLLSPSLFDGLSAGKRRLAPVFRDAMRAGRVTGEHFNGEWHDVGTVERLDHLNV